MWHPQKRGQDIIDRSIAYNIRSYLRSYNYIHGKPNLEVDSKYCRIVTIPGDWLAERADKWADYQIRKGYTVIHDIRGREAWAAPQREFLQDLLLPAPASVSGLSDVGMSRLDRLISSPVEAGFSRSHGRCYGPITTLPKTIRRQAVFNNQPVVEVDIHACFTAFVVAEMPDGREKNELIRLLAAGNFYSIFEEPFERFRSGKISEGNAVCPTGEPWNLKVEVQRQCFFGRPHICERPLFRALQRRYPLLARKILSLRQGGASQFSKQLMSWEGEVVVDQVIPQLGFPAYSLHDGILVGESFADRTRHHLETALNARLGYCPLVRVKEHDTKVKAEPLNTTNIQPTVTQMTLLEFNDGYELGFC